MYINKTVPVTVPLNFDIRLVFIHVSKADEPSGEEGGVYIHLKGPEDFVISFLLAGRNSTPEITNYISAPVNPYSPNIALATRYSGNGKLTVEFKRRISTEGGKQPVDTVDTPSILKQGIVGNLYTLLPCDNNITIGAPDPSSLMADNPAAVEAAIKRGLGEIASLMKPVFYQDNAHTLFVEPDVTERTIEEWQEWVTRTPQPEQTLWDKDRIKEIVVIPKIPRHPLIPDPGSPKVDGNISRDAIINPVLDSDWLLNSGTVLEFDGVLIGSAGQPGLEILAAKTAGGMTQGRTSVTVNAGSGLASGSTVVLTDNATLKQAGLTQTNRGLNVVGRGGLNSSLAQHFNAMNRSGFGAGGVGR